MNSLSVIISIYKNDTLPQITEMLESLYNQSYQKFDIFIQLDGNVPQDIENYLDNEVNMKRIEYLGKRDINKGLAYSLNELLEIVLKRGYIYIFRMDADDICNQKRIELQYNFMENNLDFDICGGAIEEFNTDTHEKQYIKYPLLHDDILQGMKKRNSMAHVSVCFRNSFFTNLGFYDSSKKNEDYELWIGALLAGKRFANIDKALVYVRTNNAFYDRRRDFKRAYEVMSLKFYATKKFGFGMSGYFYAIAHFILFMMPEFIKRFIYKKLRK
jgi:hypothetical protein